MTERVRIGSKMSSRLPQVPLNTPAHTAHTRSATLPSLVASPHACPSGRSLKPLSSASFTNVKMPSLKSCRLNGKCRVYFASNERTG